LHGAKSARRDVSARRSNGKKIRTFFDMGNRRGKTDLPMTYAARVRYTVETGRRHFDETIDLDLDLYMHLSEITRQGVHDVHKRLEEIRDLFKKWTWTLPHGLVAMTPEEARREGDRIAAEMEAEDDDQEYTAGLSSLGVIPKHVVHPDLLGGWRC
jgi:hypothetical protein